MTRIAFLLLTLSLTSMPAPGMAQETPAAAAGADVLHPGDLVRLQIWRETDLSGEFPVDKDGIVVLPKIGPQDVSGKPLAELRDSIVAEYRRYLRNPSIDVTFLRRVTILGAVRRPGPYPIDPTMTLADALALAGGTMPEGAPDRIEVHREGQRIETRFSTETPISDTPIRSGDLLFVPERNWVSRNTGITATLISSAVSLLVALIYVSQ